MYADSTGITTIFKIIDFGLNVIILGRSAIKCPSRNVWYEKYKLSCTMKNKQIILNFYLKDLESWCIRNGGGIKLEYSGLSLATERFLSAVGGSLSI